MLTETRNRGRTWVWFDGQGRYVAKYAKLVSGTGMLTFARCRPFKSILIEGRKTNAQAVHTVHIARAVVELITEEKVAKQDHSR